MQSGNSGKSSGVGLELGEISFWKSDFVVILFGILGVGTVLLCFARISAAVASTAENEA
jgi:hypothetical protein